MPDELSDRFPAIASWVRHGWIEIGDQEAFGFVALALDCGGVVYEDRECQTLEECMESLERGLQDHMRDRWGKEF